MTDLQSLSFVSLILLKITDQLFCRMSLHLNLSSVFSWFGEGNGTPLQYSCLENPMDGGAWKAAVHGSQRVGHDWTTSLSLFTFMHWRMKWQPTPVFLPGESQGGGAWWAAVSGVTQSRTRLKWLSSSSSSVFSWLERDYAVFDKNTTEMMLY